MFALALGPAAVSAQRLGSASAEPATTPPSPGAAAAPKPPRSASQVVALAIFGVSQPDAGADPLEVVAGHLGVSPVQLRTRAWLSARPLTQQVEWALDALASGADVALWVDVSNDVAIAVRGLFEARYGVLELIERRLDSQTSPLNDPSPPEGPSPALGWETIGVVAHTVLHSALERNMEAEEDILAAPARDPIELTSPGRTTPPPKPVPPPYYQLAATIAYVGMIHSRGALWQSGLGIQLTLNPWRWLVVAAGYTYVFDHRVTIANRIDFSLQRNLLGGSVGARFPVRQRIWLDVTGDGAVELTRYRIHDIEPEVNIADRWPRWQGNAGTSLRVTWPVHSRLAIRVGIGIEVLLPPRALTIREGMDERTVLQPFPVRAFASLGIAPLFWSRSR